MEGHQFGYTDGAACNLRHEIPVLYGDVCISLQWEHDSKGEGNAS